VKYIQFKLRVEVYRGKTADEIRRIPMSQQLEDWMLYRLDREHEERLAAQRFGGAV
jgi:hypothetical protein